MAGPIAANPLPESVALAKTVPIADVHMQGDPANVASLRKKLLEFPNSKSTGPRENWLKTIEQFPDRFMIGSDTHAPDEERYDAVMQEFREGLLPFLKPETLKNVAYQNAIRVFRLNPDPK